MAKLAANFGHPLGPSTLYVSPNFFPSPEPRRTTINLVERHFSYPFSSPPLTLKHPHIAFSPSPTTELIWHDDTGFISTRREAHLLIWGSFQSPSSSSPPHVLFYGFFKSSSPKETIISLKFDFSPSLLRHTSLQSDFQAPRPHPPHQRYRFPFQC